MQKINCKKSLQEQVENKNCARIAKLQQKQTRIYKKHKHANPKYSKNNN